MQNNFAGDGAPSLRDLNIYIVEQHASKWEKLGLELGLSDYHIANISKDNEYNPNRSVNCCRAVLQRWLQEIPSPTWGKLDDALNNIHFTTSTIDSKGMRGVLNRAETNTRFARIFVRLHNY